MLEWLKHKELLEALVDAETRKAAALERLVQCAEVALAIDPVSLAKAATAAGPQPEGTVEFVAEDQAFFDELHRIGQELAAVSGGTPSEEAILREYDLRHGTEGGVQVG